MVSCFTGKNLKSIGSVGLHINKHINQDKRSAKVMRGGVVVVVLMKQEARLQPCCVFSEVLRPYLQVNSIGRIRSLCTEFIEVV